MPAEPIGKYVKSLNKEQLVYHAKLAEQAERYDDMTEYMKAVALLDGAVLSVDERNLLSVAYKNVIGSRRAAWRVLTNIEQLEKTRGAVTEDKLVKMSMYRKLVENEIDMVCDEILSIIKALLKAVTDPESLVFYYKMCGDYHRYLAEFKQDEERASAADDALTAYTDAMKEAQSALLPTHPIRLGLALNLSVFYYEIMAEPDKACQLARDAFDQAIAQLDSLAEDSYKDATLIMQLLRDNLTLWTSDGEEKDN